MFRRNKGAKAKLEHKLYLAREAPEPIFDLSECDLPQVPQGIYSLCRVFLKEVLRLDRNCLSSLAGGGQLNDLITLKVLDLHANAFVYIPDDIQLLKNLRELYLNDNQLKKLPETIGNLSHLVILNVASNKLKSLPEAVGDLKHLKLLCITGNKHLNHLPRTLCKAQTLTSLEADSDTFIYPPAEVVKLGTEAVMRYICNDVSVDYVSPDQLQEMPLSDVVDVGYQTDPFEAKIWKLENIKKQRVQDLLEMERANELLQQQEFQLANAQKLNKEKLLADITQQQCSFDSKLMKVQQEREIDRFRLVEQVLEAEQNADIAIKKLLELSSEPLAQLLEQEKEEEERLLAAADKYNQTLRRNEILMSMEELLQQELKRFQEFDENRMEASKTILEKETQYDYLVSEILQTQDLHKAELVAKLQQDIDLQKAALGTLLERGDARSWCLLQQVRLVESQLAALTHIEMDKRKLEIDQNLNDLAEKRVHLSYLLVDLLEQQKQRRAQLLSTIQSLEEFSDSADDFWLKQYQRLLEKLPDGLSEAQRNMDPILVQALLMNGVINCLPFLAKLTQCQCDVREITAADLNEAGILNRIDQQRVLDAFHMYEKERMYESRAIPPALPVEEASAPPVDSLTTSAASECVICMDKPCDVIFVPCGHFCCCLECPVTLTECPMCRREIERKIRVIPL